MADFEALLNPWLEALIDARVVTDTPADLAGQVPLVKLTMVGGTDSDNNPDFEFATIVTESFGTDRAAALTLAAQVKTAFRRTLPTTVFGESVVTKTQTVALPGVVPYDNTNLRRVLASFRVYLHTRIAA